MAAVAVLLTNIEKTPVIRMKPNRTFSLFVPKGFSSVRANRTSSPDFVAAMAKMNPPRKSIIIGSANVAISASWSNNWLLSISDTRNLNALSEVESKSIPIKDTDVAHGDIASVTHIMVANAKIAIILR